MYDDWKKLLGPAGDLYRDPMREFFEQQRQMKDIFDPPHVRMLREFQRERDILKESSALQMIRDLNVSLGYHDKYDSILRSDLVAPVDPSALLHQSMDQYRLLGLGQEEYLRKVANLSTAAEVRLSHVPWESIGDLLGASDEARPRLQSKFTKLAVSYKRLCEPDLQDSEGREPLPEEIATLPAAEVYQSVELLDAVSSDTPAVEEEKEVPGAEHDKPQMMEIGQALRLETESVLEQLLSDINPDLVNLLAGARAALNSTNPDHVRHIAVSLRELFTHVLHALAPNDAVEKWSSEPIHYSGGKPTRRARILFICRSISFGRFSTFILKDIDAALAFVDLFQGATHEVSAQVSTEQLFVMIVRMEGLLRFLLETAKLAQ